jgi:hypothetical protein
MIETAKDTEQKENVEMKDWERWNARELVSAYIRIHMS